MLVLQEMTGTRLRFCPTPTSTCCPACSFCWPSSVLWNQTTDSCRGKLLILSPSSPLILPSSPPPPNRHHHPTLMRNWGVGGWTAAMVSHWSCHLHLLLSSPPPPPPPHTPTPRGNSWQGKPLILSHSSPFILFLPPPPPLSPLAPNP